MPTKPKRRKGKRRYKRISVKKLEQTRKDLCVLFNFARSMHYLGLKSAQKIALTALASTETIEHILMHNKNKFYVVF